MAKNKGAAKTAVQDADTTRVALAPLPKLPARARKPRPQVQCACGCGALTGRTFAPGHDSRLKGWVLRVERGIVKLADIPDGERQAVAAHIKAQKQSSAA